LLSLKYAPVVAAVVATSAAETVNAPTKPRTRSDLIFGIGSPFA
jgi:hypothetical protein